MLFGDDARVVDLIFAVALVATLFMIGRRWRRFWDADFDGTDRQLATQAAMFVVTPVVVLLHEVGHIVGAWLVGGRVLGFHYGLIEGAVTVAGGLSPAADWFVAFAGNAAGLLVGLALGVTGVAAVRLPRPLRHVLIFGGLFEVAFHLVLYPLLSLSSRIGDWSVIYDFGATPGLSAVTAVGHVAVLAAAWTWWRSTVRRTLFNVDHGLDDEVRALEAAMAASPADPEPAIQLAVLYARNGDMALARETLETAAAGAHVVGAGAGRLHLVRARLATIEGRWNQAYIAAQDGLRAVGESDTGELAQRLWANGALALASMGRPEQALGAFAHLSPPVSEDPRVLYARGLARRACGDDAGAEADLRSVVGWRPEGDLLRLWAEAKLEGREPPPPDDRDRPNYARRTKAPPAPIAGV